MQEEKSQDPWWLTHKSGNLLVQTEKELLDSILPSLYGYHLVQLGPPRLASLVSSTLISHRILINLQGNSNWPCSIIKGQAESLSIQHDTIDVAVLTHSLELADQPHQVLREAHRCLIPEGHIIITGINPFSLWGLITLLKKSFKRGSHVKMISPTRVKDWLKLLDVEITQYHKFMFSPPMSHQKTRKRLTFLESMGQKFWPFFGGAYMIVGVKKIVGLTTIKPSFYKKENAWNPQEVPGSASYKRDKS